MSINVNVKDVILIPNEEVFDAIVNPNRITKYFTSAMVGNLATGEKVKWIFEDVGIELEIKVLKLVKNKSLTFEWEASGKLTTVVIELSNKDVNKTEIGIQESSFELNEADVQNALLQTQGWTDFICSLKAYLYTGINLRKGRAKLSN